MADFGTGTGKYGQLHAVSLDGYNVDVLPLAHPRQAARLGVYSPKWRAEHQGWLEEQAGKLLQ